MLIPCPMDDAKFDSDLRQGRTTAEISTIGTQKQQEKLNLSICKQTTKAQACGCWRQDV